MKDIKTVVFLFLAIMLCACGGHYDARLVEIDSLTTNGNAQQAVAMLDSMGNMAEDFSTADRMYFELLRIKARDKAYINHQSDSCLTDVISYFEHHDKEKLAEAYYYAGSVYRDMHDSPQAVAYFQKCIATLPDDDCLRMKSNACFQCGYLFQEQQLKEQAVEMFQESFRCDSIQKDTVRMIESLSHLAQSYGIILEKKKFEDVVLSRLRKARDLACAINNKYLIMTTTIDIVRVYSYQDKYDKVAELMPELDKSVKDYNDTIENQNYKYIKARQLIALKRYDEALPYCEFLKDCDFYDYRRYAAQYLFKIYASKGDFAKANYFADRYEFMTDSIMVAKAYDATAQANALYNYQLRERDNITLKAENQERLYMIFILGIFLIAALLTFWVYQLRQKQKRQILNQQLARLHQFEKMQQEQSETSAALQSLTRQSLIESQAYEIIRQRITEDQPLTDADISIIDETVNHFCDGFKSTLYSAYNLSAQEYAVCLLLKFDISATDISRLLNRTAAAITQTRKRLYQKLFGQKGSANDLDAYIRSI